MYPKVSTSVFVIEEYSSPYEGNLPILYQNVCGSLTLIGKTAFLWAADNHDSSKYKYKSEDYARKTELLVNFNATFLPLAVFPKRNNQQIYISSEVLDDLMKFILKRHAVYFFKKQLNMWWEFDGR